MRGLIGNGEIFGGSMESGLMSSGLVRNKPSQNVFEPVEYINEDPFKDNVVLYLKGDGADGSTNIIDSSPNPKTITRFGDTKISTNQSKYGGSSIYFDGTEDYLEASPINFEQFDFTIEFWVNIQSIQDSSFISHGIRPNSSNRQFFCRLKSGTEIELGLYPNDTFISNTFNYTINNWYHIAFVRNNDSIVIFVDGSIFASGTYNSALNVIASPLIIGASNNNGFFDRFSHCYIDSLRITKEIPRYTTNFNPETDTYLAY